MNTFGSDTFTLMPIGDGTSGTIIAEVPYDRSELQNFIANARMAFFGGVKVPFRVITTNLVTGATSEEYIPGCASCGIGGA